MGENIAKATLCRLLGSNQDKMEFCDKTRNGDELHEIFIGLTDLDYKDNSNYLEYDVLNSICLNKFTKTETLIGIEKSKLVKNNNQKYSIERLLLKHGNYPINKVCDKISKYHNLMNERSFEIAAGLEHPDIPDSTIKLYSNKKYRIFTGIYSIILQKTKDIDFIHKTYGEICEDFFFYDFLTSFLINPNIESYMIHSIVVKHLETQQFLNQLSSNELNIINHPNIRVSTLNLLKSAVRSPKLINQIESKIKSLEDDDEE